MTQTAVKQDNAPDMIPFIDLQAQRKRIVDEVNQEIQNVLAHGQYIMGAEVGQIEERLSAFCGVKNTLSCSNGTDALALGLMALGIKPGDAVFVPSFTFCATAEVVAWMGATPVFVDSEAETFNIDPQGLAQAVEFAKKQGLNPACCVPVDLFGHPADYDAIEDICKGDDIKIMADSAQAFGCRYKDRISGNFGDLATTSFFPAKPLGCYGDGGAVFTNDDDLYAILDSLRIHGKGTDKYDNIRIGMNGRMDTMQAAILKPKLAIYEDEIALRNEIADAYHAGLGDIVKTPQVAEGCMSVWAQYTLTLAEGADREAFMAHMKSRGIPTVIYYPKPLHMQTAYKDFPTGTGAGLPVCENLGERVVSLPMYPYMPDDHISRVIEAAREFFA